MWFSLARLQYKHDLVHFVILTATISVVYSSRWCLLLENTAYSSHIPFSSLIYMRLNHKTLMPIYIFFNIIHIHISNIITVSCDTHKNRENSSILIVHVYFMIQFVLLVISHCKKNTFGEWLSLSHFKWLNSSLEIHMCTQKRMRAHTQLKH